MCGLLFVQRKDLKPAQKQTLKRYHKQKGRGSDGYGYIAISNGIVETVKHTQTEEEIKKTLQKQNAESILFHHRYPTSAPNLPETAHPILVSHDELKHDYYVTHNGVITNDHTLKPDHEKLGYKYRTTVQTCYETVKGYKYYTQEEWNDSEALAIELARNIEGITNFTGATGAIAYIVLQVDKVSRNATGLYYGTNGGNPLTKTDDKIAFTLASEGGQAIKSNQCYRYDMSTGLTEEIHHVQMSSYYSQYEATHYSSDYRSIGEIGYDIKRYSSSYKQQQRLEEAEAELEEANELLDVAIENNDIEGAEILYNAIDDLEKEINTLYREYDETPNNIPF